MNGNEDSKRTETLVTNPYRLARSDLPPYLCKMPASRGDIWTEEDTIALIYEWESQTTKITRMHRNLL